MWVEEFLSCLEGMKVACLWNAPGTPLESAEPVHLARTTLERTRAALVRRQDICPVLPPWLSEELTALLLQKVSFGRGGGQQGAISRERMRVLLSNPRKLIRYLCENKLRASLFTAELAALEHWISACDAS